MLRWIRAFITIRRASRQRQREMAEAIQRVEARALKAAAELDYQTHLAQAALRAWVPPVAQPPQSRRVH